MDTILKFENVSKTFKLSAKQKKIDNTKEAVKVALDKVSFEADRGEIFGLLGPNGAGKTTALRIMATLIKPISGDVFVNGISVVKDPEKVRGHIGFLTSELKLEGFFTPNYLFDYFSSLYGVTENVRKERKAALFTRFGIDKFAEVKVSNLSTGMAQKTSLAISLVHDPEIIIFDEPTNGLDVLTAKTVTDYLLELRAAGKSIILSTHIFSLVEKLCDRVGILIDGKIAALDTLKNITAEKPLEDVFFDLYSKARGANE